MEDITVELKDDVAPAEQEDERYNFGPLEEDYDRFYCRKCGRTQEIKLLD